ncbi:MAG TPA: hypothetical protein VN711_04655 [Candidatus Saccharimonadales bacterium]|nr:hypothetical protein [Candidatus Saccharimonadales bacterium]
MLFACYSTSMLLALLLILIVLWFLGYIPINFFAVPSPILFSLNGHPITIWSLLIFLVIFGIISMLPTPFREIAGIIFLLWILSVLGIFLIGLSSPLVVILIIGVIIMLFIGM